MLVFYVGALSITRKLLEAGYPYDSSRISDEKWKLRGEILLTLEDFEKYSSIIRTDVIIEEDLIARLYKVPEWYDSKFF